ncbi:hypothetical protein D3C78_1773450 [compost metagenome]
MQVQRRCIEVLRRHPDLRHRLEGRIAFAPFNAGVFNRHVLVGVLSLDLQDETRGYPVGRQLLIQRIAQEVRQLAVLFRQVVGRATARIGHDPELRIGFTEFVG